MIEPYYADDTVTVYAGDCLNILRELPDASVDAVVTDPPYALPGGFMSKAWDEYDGREDSAFAYWLAGLIDGEGHFAIKQHTRGTHAPMFQLSMRDDEAGTIEAIRRHLRIGSVTRVKHQPHDVVRWIVQDKAGCQRLVDLLDKYPLRAKKRLDYMVWREAVCEWSSRPRGNRWHGAADNTHMGQLRDRIMSVRHHVEPAWSGHEFQDWCRLWARECLRILKPGGHLLAFGGTRTWHRLACAVEDAGFEIRDTLAWLYGSGFPKSLDVSKAIDKAAGVEREVVAEGQPVKRMIPGADQNRTGSWIKDNGREYVPTVTQAATDAARRWEGFGTALKPSHEPIVVARKPLAGTVAANVVTHGTGGLNIDGCRIGLNGGTRDPGHAPGGPTVSAYGDGLNGRASEPVPGLGRWPANVVLDGEAAQQLDQQTGELTSGGGIKAPPGKTHGFADGRTSVRHDGHKAYERDAGGASRFMYTAKADSGERVTVNGTSHPCVKPLDLMRWLTRLVTPPGGLVLDPFAGSGTTVEACIFERFRCIAIERETDYLPLITQRINRRRDPAAYIAASGEDGGLFDLLNDEGVVS